MLLLISYIWLFITGKGVKSAVTDAEIAEISERIWASDTNRFSTNDLVYDLSARKLFQYVNEGKLVGTYKRMMDLRDNYIAQTGQADTCLDVCTNEQEDFIDAILATQPIQILHKFLVDEGLATRDPVRFKQDLLQYWFLRYSRSNGVIDSSGFEHVFIGEIKKNEVTGFHSWLSMYLEEKAGRFVYRKPLDSCQNRIEAISFEWYGALKPITSTMIGASPEAEIALYTLCLLSRIGGNCNVYLAGRKQEITVWNYNGVPTTIGTSYPDC